MDYDKLISEIDALEDLLEKKLWGKSNRDKAFFHIQNLRAFLDEFFKKCDKLLEKEIELKELEESIIEEAAERARQILREAEDERASLINESEIVKKAKTEAGAILKGAREQAAKIEMRVNRIAIKKLNDLDEDVKIISEDVKIISENINVANANIKQSSDFIEKTLEDVYNMKRDVSEEIIRLQTENEL